MHNSVRVAAHDLVSSLLPTHVCTWGASFLRTEKEFLVGLLIERHHHHHSRAHLIGHVPQRIGRAKHCLSIYVPVECHSERRWHLVRLRLHHRSVPLAQLVERPAAPEQVDAVEVLDSLGSV